MKHCMMIPSVLGKLLLEEEDGKIVRLLFERDICLLYTSSSIVCLARLKEIRLRG